MKDISISAVLDSMNGDTAYMTDMWENCVDEKRKRYTRSKFSDALDMMERFRIFEKIWIQNRIILYKTKIY